jgi:hypothetical protein
MYSHTLEIGQRLTYTSDGFYSSGGVAQMESFLKFFPEVLRKMKSTKCDTYCKYDNHLLYIDVHVVVIPRRHAVVFGCKGLS